jgi:hypothetical protein
MLGIHGTEAAHAVRAIAQNKTMPQARRSRARRRRKPEGAAKFDSIIPP